MTEERLNEIRAWTEGAGLDDRNLKACMFVRELLAALTAPVEGSEVAQMVKRLTTLPFMDTSERLLCQQAADILTRLSAANAELVREREGLKELVAATLYQANVTQGKLSDALIAAEAKLAEAVADARAKALEEAAKLVETIVVSGPEDDEIDHDDYRDMQIAKAIRTLSKAPQS